MRKLRLRAHALLGLGLLLLSPWIFFLTGYFLVTGSLELGEDRPNAHAVPMAAAFAGLLFAFALIGVLMRKFLLKPLEGLGQAARRIAEGEWDVRLSPSTVREIAEVRDGFDYMVRSLQDSQRKQAELEEERRFLIAALAHDLRTPLFALRGYLDGLEQGIARTPDQISKYVAVCKEQSAQLDRLVEDLFTFAKAEYQETERSGKSADLGDVIRNSVARLEPQARSKRISMLVRAEPDDYVIRADAHVLERAMSNLLDNAVRHTPADGRIVVQYGRENGRVVFAVRDSGPGFAAEELERVFDPLYRGEQSRSRATGGAGLGLAISRRIVRRHGGELSAGNHPSGGAVVSGWLPLDQRAAPLISIDRR